MRAIEAKALLDTGATRSAISKSIVDRLELDPKSRSVVKFGNSEQIMDFFLYRFGFLDGMSSVSAPYILDVVSGFLFTAAHEFDAIVGMDVLQHCDLEISREGYYVLTLP